MLSGTFTEGCRKLMIVAGDQGLGCGCIWVYHAIQYVRTAVAINGCCAHTYVFSIWRMHACTHAEYESHITLIVDC